MPSRLNFQFVRFRRWHVLRPDDYLGPKTYCGLDSAERERVDKRLPGLTCEKCDKAAVTIADAG